MKENFFYEPGCSRSIKLTLRRTLVLHNLSDRPGLTMSYQPEKCEMEFRSVGTPDR